MPHTTTLPPPTTADTSPQPPNGLSLGFLRQVQLHWRVVLVALVFVPLFGWSIVDSANEFGDWPQPVRQSLLVFAAAIIGWTVLKLDDTPVAMAACVLLIALGVIAPENFYATLGSDLIWLLLGAFLLSAVLQQSGLAERWTLRALAGVQNMGALMTRLTWLIAATAFIVPSTSGRAALLLPVFVALCARLQQPHQVRALALLFPTVILLSACISLLGAGAHLVALDFMRRLSADAPGFAGWVLLAAPFGIASSLFASWMISRLFLSPTQRRQSLQIDAPTQEPLSKSQRNVVIVTAAALLGWATSGLHGIDAALIALAAGFVATLAPLTGVNLKTALKKVEWNVLLFLAATLAMGQALLDTGAARLLAQSMLAHLPLGAMGELGVLVLAAVIALLSHLLITSRTARAVVLIPTLALPLAATGVDASLLIFVTIIGSGYCQTFKVSAKPVAVFAAEGCFADTDLLKLSAALLLPLLAMLVYFAFVVWPAMGL